MLSLCRAITSSAIAAPTANVGLRSPPGATSASVVANAIEPRIEPSEMNRVTATVATNTAAKAPNAGGESASSTPAVVATGSPCRSMAADGPDSLLFVGCPHDGKVYAYAIGADGTLSPTSWSPLNASGAAFLDVVRTR